MFPLVSPASVSTCLDMGLMSVHVHTCGGMAVWGLCVCMCLSEGISVSMMSCISICPSAQKVACVVACVITSESDYDYTCMYL